MYQWYKTRQKLQQVYKYTLRIATGEIIATKETNHLLQILNPKTTKTPVKGIWSSGMILA